jgi:CheY-like chemotaxis protein
LRTHHSFGTTIAILHFRSQVRVRRQAIQPTRVLIVDDEFLIRWSLGQFLESEGYEVTTAKDGVEALEVASAAWFDYVITDLSMPRLDGWGLLDNLTQFRPAPRVIVITGQDEEDNRRKVVEKGGWAYLEKSYLISEIKDAMETGIAVRNTSCRELSN